MGKAWTTSDGGKVICDNCGQLYKRTLHHYPMRDSDNFRCSCGEVIESWNSTSAPAFEIVDTPK